MTASSREPGGPSCQGAPTADLMTLPGHQGSLDRAGHRRSLTALEAASVVARNTVASVRYPVSSAVIRTCSVRYAANGSALYIPAWTDITGWYEIPPLRLECDVSEVEGRACWRYVWLRGYATPLHPTGPAAVRQAWRDAIAHLRGALPSMPAIDELTVTNFGIVRLDVVSWDGAIVPCE